MLLLGCRHTITKLAPALAALVYDAELEASLEIPVLLRRVVEEARSVAGPRYVALGVLVDEDTVPVKFIALGLGFDDLPDWSTSIGALGQLDFTTTMWPLSSPAAVTCEDDYVG